MSTITLPARMENLRRLIQFVSGCARQCGYSESRTNEIELAAEEALVNICRYAYPEEAGDVALTCRRSGRGRIVIKIEDSGIPFNPLSIPEPDLRPDIARRKAGGLGIFLMRKMVNEIRYRRDTGKNILTFIVSPERLPADPLGKHALSTQ
ncbi:ATP-binding protein [Methanoregula sp.]|uniref:ATP-binding protein n=1 Tax=Methanoregula sp. TaxID=2052170 RepID=UPI000CB0CCF9|nr:ATP-binding protein [Methanoregula sp.]PKG31246.1 MAG: ATP-binding protein [Methanoregula sp.]